MRNFVRKIPWNIFDIMSASNSFLSKHLVYIEFLGLGLETQKKIVKKNRNAITLQVLRRSSA